MASSGVGVSAAAGAGDGTDMPDNVCDWLRGVYRFATDRNDFRRHYPTLNESTYLVAITALEILVQYGFLWNLILNLGLFAAGVWLARNLSDIDLMAPQPGV